MRRVVGSVVPKVLKEPNAFVCKVRHAKRHIQYRMFIIFLGWLDL